MLHSARSDPGTGDVWREEYGRADIVLDEKDIERDSPTLGTRVTVRLIDGGVSLAEGVQHQVMSARGAAFRQGSRPIRRTAAA